MRFDSIGYFFNAIVILKDFVELTFRLRFRNLREVWWNSQKSLSLYSVKNEMVF